MEYRVVVCGTGVVYDGTKPEALRQFNLFVALLGSTSVPLAGERRRTVVGVVIPKRSANPWKKIWENLIQWGDFLANENRIDRDPGTLHL